MKILIKKILYDIVYLIVLSQDLDFQCHMLWSFYVFSLVSEGEVDKHCLNFLFMNKIQCAIFNLYTVYCFEHSSDTFHYV